jgi:hypothetical protein
LIEPLAKTGQLNVVVATMGLAAGINFSMRSVLITDTRYLAGNFERHVQPDELLQMFGRAGRRGLDETGYVLMLPDIPRLGDARARQLKRATQVDWPSLISVMHGATDRGEQPFAAAVELSRSLYSRQQIPIGSEHSLSAGEKPCRLWVDAERARFVRRPLIEMLNSANEWEAKPLSPENVSLGQLLVRENGAWICALALPRMLDRRGFGNLCKLRDQGIYGREIPLATVLAEDAIMPVKWLRRLLGGACFPVSQDSQRVEKELGRAEERRSLAGGHPRSQGYGGATRPPLQPLTRARFDDLVLSLIPEATGGKIAALATRGGTIYARIDFSDVPISAVVDSHGRALLDPPDRDAIPMVCRACSQLEHDLATVITNSPAYAWRQLGLVAQDGTPTRRGTLFSFFQAGEGLAIAAALEDETYPIDELVFDLANIRAGSRFAGEDAPLGGRLGILCQRIYGRADHPGYLEMGVPVHYGSGASEVIRELVDNPSTRYRMTNESLRSGDIERALMEWRSLLRHIVGAPPLKWDRWRSLQEAAARFIGSTTSPAAVEFPPLLASQQSRPRLAAG